MSCKPTGQACECPGGVVLFDHAAGSAVSVANAVTTALATISLISPAYGAHVLVDGAPYVTGVLEELDLLAGEHAILRVVATSRGNAAGVLSGALTNPIAVWTHSEGDPALYFSFRCPTEGFIINLHHSGVGARTFNTHAVAWRGLP